MKRFILFGAGMLLAIASTAQFTLEADIRPRVEFRQGYRQMPNPDSKPGANISQRTRLILGFRKDKIMTKVSFQNVRIWGQQLPISQEPSFDLHEAWVQLQLTDAASLKLGRQEIRYDNQRFFALNDWNQIGQKHDALIFRRSSAKSELHIGAAFNQSADRLFFTQYYLNNYKTLNYAWYRTHLSPAVGMSLLGVLDGYEHPDNPQLLYMRATGSAYFDAEVAEKLTITINPALQGGKTRRGDDIRAWYFMTEVTADIFNPLRSTIGFEYYTGIDYENPDEYYRAFDPLYGAGHTAHGHMDYFTNITSHTKGAGLVNPYFKNRLSLGEKAYFDADLHLFYLQNNYVHQGEVISKNLGTEIDFTLNYHINPFTQLLCGYSMMFGTESLEVIRGGSKDEFAHWAFIMLRVRPKFL